MGYGERTVQVPQAATGRGRPQTFQAVFTEKIIKQKGFETSLCKCLPIKQQQKHTHTLQELKLPGVMHSEVG